MMKSIKNEFTDSYIILTHEEYAAIEAYVKKNEKLGFARQYLRGIKRNVINCKYKNIMESVLHVEKLLGKFAECLETDIRNRLRAGESLEVSTFASYAKSIQMNKYRCISNSGTISETVNIVKMPHEMADAIRNRLDSIDRISVELFDIDGNVIDTEFIDEIVRC